MTAIVNPVLPFFTFMNSFFSCIPTTIQFIIIFVFGSVLLFAVVKSFRGGT